MTLRSFVSLAGTASSVAAALLFTSTAAWANGRFPQAGQLVVDPSDPSHVIARSTYGLSSTTDGGQSWGWICEKAVGFGDNEDPMVGITADGTIVAATSGGIGHSKDACAWEVTQDETSPALFVDLSVDRSDASRIVAITQRVGTTPSELWQSTNNGASWSKLGNPLPDDIAVLTVDLVPSDASRIYVSGRRVGGIGVLARSMDAGDTWETFDIAGTETDDPFIAAIDPLNKDHVFVRTDGDPSDSLLLSSDGGESFDVLLKDSGSMLGFALSPDASEVRVGGDQGLFGAATSDFVFSSISAQKVYCLTWTDDALFGCANHGDVGYSVGTSSDGGKTFTAFFELADLCEGPLSCGAGTTVESLCPAAWTTTRTTLGLENCDAQPDASASSSSSGTPSETPAADDGGCAFQPPSGTRSLALLGGLAGLLIVLRRRRA